MVLSMPFFCRWIYGYGGQTMELTIALVVSYDGSEYVGFQSQPGLKSIQGVLEKAIEKITKHQVSILGSGRTDAGVHANGQVVSFKTTRDLNEKKWPLALNSCLPSTIRIRKAYLVESDFHVIYDVQSKTYRYEVCTAPVYNVHLRHMQFHFPLKLDIELMRRAAQVLVGTHDFRSFCVAKSIKDNNVRTIESIEITLDQSTLRFDVTGNGFLHNMVRIIVGTLLYVGNQRIDMAQVQAMLNGATRHSSILTVPAHGLVLWAVRYSNFTSE